MRQIHRVLHHPFARSCISHASQVGGDLCDTMCAFIKFFVLLFRCLDAEDKLTHTMSLSSTLHFFFVSLCVCNMLHLQILNFFEAGEHIHIQNPSSHIKARNHTCIEQRI